MQHCPKKNTPMAIGVSADGRFATATKLGCKMWDCPYCSIRRKGFLVIKTYQGIEHYKANGSEHWYFGTLTMHKNWRGWASIVNFQKNWNKFYQRLKRATDETLYYVLLPETHRDGSLHVHLISTCPQSKDWWKDNGAACGMGFKNDNQPLHSTSKAAWYVTKYVQKSLGRADWPLRFRRVRFSRFWPEPQSDASWQWYVIHPMAARAAIFSERDKGREIINAITGQISEPIESTKRIPYPVLAAGKELFQDSAIMASIRMGEEEDKIALQPYP